MRYLSGTTGYTILNNSDRSKSILLLADIHDGVSYCLKDKPAEYIDEFLERKSKSHQILLEEATNNNDLNLTDLWPDAEHTSKLKKLKENNDNIIPVDLRPYLILFSWQLANSNKRYIEMKINKYLYNFDIFFNKRGKVYEKYISPYIEFIDSEYLKILNTLFEEIRVLYLKNKDTYSGLSIGEILEKDKKYMHFIDHINSLIMEYYTLLLIFSDKRDSIIHTGLAHSTRIKKFLVEKFNFDIYKDINMTDISQYTGSDSTNACVLHPKINNFFI
jgi:hypothetical protein